MFIIYAETDYFLCDVRAGAEEIFEQLQYKTAQSDGSTSTDKIKHCNMSVYTKQHSSAGHQYKFPEKSCNNCVNILKLLNAMKVSKYPSRDSKNTSVLITNRFSW